MLTVGLGLQSSVWIVFRYGFLWGILAFIVMEAVLFFVIGYGISMFVLFLYQRYSPDSRIGFEAHCYILTHFKESSTQEHEEENDLPH